MNIIKTDPTLKDVLDIHKENIMISICSQHIGRVVAVNHAAQTVDVKISYDMAIFERDRNNKITEKVVSYPLLKNVPFEFSRAGAFKFTMPIVVGETCIISFNDRDISNWYNGIIGGKNNTPRLHSLSDAIARIGLSNLKTKVTYDPDNIHIGTDDTYLKFKTGSIEIKNQNAHLGEELSSLCDKLGTLIDAIAAITVQVGSVTSSVPNNAAAISAIKPQIEQIKTKISGLLE